MRCVWEIMYNPVVGLSLILSLSLSVFTSHCMPFISFLFAGVLITKEQKQLQKKEPVHANNHYSLAMPSNLGECVCVYCRKLVTY